MEREQEAGVTAADASQQLEQVQRDQRWAKLTGDVPAGYEVVFGGGLVVHLLLVGLMMGLSSGRMPNFLGLDTDGLFIMAVVNLALPVYGHMAFQRAQSGSWRGTPDTRFSRLELGSVAASYLLGLGLVIVMAAHSWWVPVVSCAVLAGVAWLLVCRHWMVRYRAEVGYRGSVRTYAKFPLFVLLVAGANLLWLVGLSLVPGL